MSKKLNLSSIPPAPCKMTELKMAAWKALDCIYIAVQKDIADDLNDKVRSYIEALEDSLRCANKRLADLKKPLGAFGDRSTDGSGPTDD